MKKNHFSFRTVLITELNGILNMESHSIKATLKDILEFLSSAEDEITINYLNVYPK